jgi:putative ABC transport system permease protein
VFALFVGMFIIYNSFATAVAQRRSEIGILRALGATQRQVGLLFLQESLALGAIGALIGVAVGVSIARAVAASIVAMTAAVYGVGEEAPSVVVTPIVVGTGLLLGLATSVMAAVIPAWQAAHVDPVHAMRKAAYEMAARSRRLPVVAGVLAGAAAICLAFGGVRPLFYASYVLLIVALLVMSTILSGTLAQVIRPLLRWIRPVEGVLAADSLLQAPRRTGMTVSGLMLSLALVVAFSGMARSSYSSILQWINTTLNPDLFVMPSPRVELRTRRFPAAMAEELASLQGVQHVQMFRSGRITFRDNPALIVGLEMAKVAETSQTEPVAGDAATMYERSAAGQGLLVSDSLAQLHSLTLGEVLSIPAPYGTVQLPIVGILIDYTDQQGTIFIDRSVFVQNWRDDSVSDFRVYLHPDARSSDVQQQIVEQYAGRQQVFVLTNQEVRDYVLQLANQWFGLMDVQIAVAVFVAILGIINTLTVSITDRRRELGVLQAVGAVRAQIRRTIWLEALAIGAIGLALGAAVGALNLYYILEMVRLDVIGLRLEYSYPMGTILLLVPIILGAAFIAALWPAESVLRGSLVEALEYE